MSVNPNQHPISASEAQDTRRPIVMDEPVLAVAVEADEEAVPVLLVEEDESEIPVATVVQAARPAPTEPLARKVEQTDKVPARVRQADVMPGIPAPARPVRRFRLSLHVILMAFAAMVLGQFALISYMKFAGRGERLQRLEELAASATPAGSDLDVKVLLEFLESPEQRDTAAQTLSRLQGGSFINDMLLAHLDQVRTLPVCAKLVEVLGERKITSAFQPVLELLKDYRPEVQRQAWTALSRITTLENLPTLLKSVPGDSGSEAGHIVRSLVSLVEKADDRAAVSRLIASAYEASVKNAGRREILLKVLSKTGGAEALAIVSAAIADPATAVRQAAIYAVAQYPTHDLLPVLAARFPEETDPACREYLILAVIELISQPGPHSQNTLARHAQSLYANAKTVEERQTALRAISAVIAPETATFYREFAEKGDPALRKEALEMSAIFQSKLDKVILIPAGPGGGATSLPAAQASTTLGGHLQIDNEVLSNWVVETDSASWLVLFPATGAYEVNVYQAQDRSELGTYEILLAGQTLLTTVVKTDGPDDFKGFVAGTVNISEPGIFRLTLRPRRLPAGGDLFRLQKLSIKAAGGKP